MLDSPYGVCQHSCAITTNGSIRSGCGANAREHEQHIVDMCLNAASNRHVIISGKEACMVRLAGLLARIHHPEVGQHMLDNANAYFERYPDQSLATVEIIRRGWIIGGLPRFRAMMDAAISRRSSKKQVSDG